MIEDIARSLDDVTATGAEFKATDSDGNEYRVTATDVQDVMLSCGISRDEAVERLAREVAEWIVSGAG